MPGSIHHVQWCVSDLDRTCDKLTSSYGFRATFERTDRNREVLVEQGSVRFLITERGPPPRSNSSSIDTLDTAKNNENDNKACTEYPWILCKCRNAAEHTTDSVFNVVLEVGDVDLTLDAMRSHGSVALQDTKTLTTSDGALTVAIVTSPCDNVIHTLVNTKHYSGQFLPGFKPVVHNRQFNGEQQQQQQQQFGSDIKLDHLTYVCRPGESRHILDWYKTCCGMERFIVDTEDDLESGIVIKDEAGMRMMVGEWLSEWLCREEGVEATDSNFKLVLAEPLHDHPHSHVNTFIRKHGGPGLQHIGLLTSDIVSHVQQLQDQGAQFRYPPPTYYRLTGKMADIQEVGGDIQTFTRLGILVDKEAGGSENDKPRFILQIFTRPLFKEETFFLEAIQRQGSRGFGAGNIRALAQSIILLEQQERKTDQPAEEKQDILETGNPKQKTCYGN